MSPDDHFPASATHADMRNGTRKVVLRFKTAFTVALLLLVVAIAMAVKMSRVNLAALAWVSHTHDVIECVTDLAERNSSRELAMRNYIRHGGARFRESFDKIDPQVKDLGDRLMALVVDNPVQVERARRIEVLMDERSRALTALLKEYSPANSEHLLASNVVPSSIMLDAVDSAISPFRAEEQRLLGERRAKLDWSVKFIDLLIPAVGVTGLLVLLGCQIAISRYLSQTRRAQAEAHTAKKTADEANKFKSAFLANVSHEIRTPLAAIIGYTDILRSDKPLSLPERDEYLRTVSRSGEQVLTIVNDLLDLSKIEAGRMTTERIPCCIVEVIADVASLFRRIAADRGLFFEVKFLDPIPAQIRTDPARLRQALMNIVGNAVKFTERGGVRIVIDLFQNGGVSPLLRLRVVDTGIGLSPEIVATLFQPFIQADVSTTRRFGGTGLGLTISRHFAELLGGGITVESEVDRGSTFTITVATGDLGNVRMLTGVTESTRDSERSVAAVPRRLAGRRVLVAEDGVDNQQIIMFHLREAGAEVKLAENGKVAVQLAIEMADANQPFDLVLMDMQMPVMDGYIATKTLRDQRYTGPIVALTANAMAHDRQKCLTAGCNGFITKPIQWPIFWQTVREFVKEASPAPAAARISAVPPIVATTPPAADPIAGELSPAAGENLAQLTAKFTAALTERAAEIQTAFKDRDRVKMRFLAHSLSAAAGAYGFPEAGQIARQLDLNYDADDSRIVDMLKELDTSVSRSLLLRAG